MRMSTLVLCLAVPVGAAQAQINFAPATVVGSGAGDTHFSGGVGIGDLDSDGRPDLFVFSDGIHWFLNRLPQGFIAAPAPLAAAGILLRDIDGDGLIDSYGYSSFFPGDGTQVLTFVLRRGLPGGQFAAEESFDFGTLPAGALGLYFDDRDGDGDLDLTLFTGQTWTRLTNDGTAFTSTHTGNIMPPLGPAVRLAADLDADGLLDFVVGPSVLGPRQVLRGEADGNLALAPDLLPDGDGITAVWTADFDGDGRQDLLVRRAPATSRWEIGLLLRGADDSLVESDVLVDSDARWFSRAYQAAEPTLLDLDGDGRPELVAQTGPDGCPGPFACPPVITNPYGYSWLEFSTSGQISEGAAYSGGLFAFADFDGDGRGDALGAANGNLVWRRGVSTANSPPVVAVEQQLLVQMGDGEFNGWLHLGATDVDEQLLTLRVVDAPTRAGASVTVSGGWVYYDRGDPVSGGHDSFEIEVDDGAGGVVRTRVSVEIEGFGGGSPDPLTFAGLLLAAGWSARRRLLRA